MNEKEQLEFFSVHSKELRDKLEKQALLLAEQAVKQDMEKHNDNWFLGFIAIITLAILGFTAIFITTANPDTCSKFEGLGFKAEVCNSNWFHILLLIVLVVGIYGGVKFVDNYFKRYKE